VENSRRSGGLEEVEEWREWRSEKASIGV